MKVVEIIEKYNNNKWLCVCFVNAKADISTSIDGLPTDATLAPGSLIYTGSLEVGVLKEDGTWGWR